MKWLWTGTDSLMLVDYSMRTFKKKVYWWFFRRFVRIGELFIQEHYCDAANIADNLRKFGVNKPIKIVPDQVCYTEKFSKVPHDSFNILYYMPEGGDRKFRGWLFGYDIFLEVRNHFAGSDHVRFRIISGKSDMEVIFPIIDFYLRPNRHDGASRLRQECDVQEIPYYWTQSNPNAEDAIKAINDVKKTYKD